MRGFGGSLAASLVLVALAALAGEARAQSGPPREASWAPDPVYVYYPRADCRGDQIELEIWDREDARWRAHPGHPRVPVDTCQLEDAGNLLNELRMRCVEPPESDPPPVWVVGLDVFDPEVMESCATESFTGRQGGLDLALLEPRPGQRLALPRFEVPVLGALHMGGALGASYDVVLVIDRSQPESDGAPDLLDAQLQAARRWLAALAPRLGPVRVGIVEYPNMPPLPDAVGGAGARRVVGLTDDPFALEDGLAELARRGPSGIATPSSAFAFAEAELRGLNPGARPRPGARKRVVMTSTTLGARHAGERLGEALVAAFGHEVRVDLFALGGLAEAADEAARELFASVEGSFHRVPAERGRAGFLNAVDLPFVTQVLLANPTADVDARPTALLPDGRFRARVAVVPGANRLVARALLSNGESVEREWEIDFDDRVVKELILAAEREHMRKIREKELELRPQWERPLPPELGGPKAE